MKVTVSFGVTEIEPGDTPNEIFGRADKALFASKDNGRNRTTALTKTEFLSGKAETPQVAPVPTYDYDGSFLACATSDMIVLNFGSFVRELNARLMQTDQGHAVIRLGSTFLLPFWGAKQARQPVELDITFGPPPKDVLLPQKQRASEPTSK